MPVLLYPRLKKVTVGAQCFLEGSFALSPHVLEETEKSIDYSIGDDCQSLLIRTTETITFVPSEAVHPVP